MLMFGKVFSVFQFLSFFIIFRYLLKSSCGAFSSSIVILFALISLRKSAGFAFTLKTVSMPLHSVTFFKSSYLILLAHFSILSSFLLSIFLNISLSFEINNSFYNHLH